MGLPMFNKAPTNDDFQFIPDNMNLNLACWKTKFLNVVGRTTLARAFLNSILNYVMQFIPLPNTIWKKIWQDPEKFHLRNNWGKKKNITPMLGSGHWAQRAWWTWNTKSRRQKQGYTCWSCLESNQSAWFSLGLDPKIQKTPTKITTPPKRFPEPGNVSRGVLKPARMLPFG